MIAYLCLEDGRVFEGKSIGLVGEAEGEVVFNTSMTGYQEILTDPSYAGQIITLTYPLIGNYGVNDKDAESSGVKAKGFIVKELCNQPSNYRAEQNLHRFLVSQNVVAIKDVDTRALTRHLRQTGTMLGIISTESDLDKLREKAKALKTVTGPHLVRSVTSKEAYTIPGGQHRIVLLDFGAKANIANSLKSLDCQVTIVPADTSADEIMSYNPSGVVLSNGPGDPQDVPYAISTIKEILNKNVPVMGICLGHQLLGMSLGGTTYKLKFGHRGGNHPVKDLGTKRSHITSQNHGYALSADSLNKDEIEITHINLHDNTVEGIRHKSLKAFSIQFHPEACPGPQDTFYLFQQFMEMVIDYEEKQGEGGNK